MKPSLPPIRTPQLVRIRNSPYQLFVVVRGEIPDVNGPTLVPHHQGGLVGMQAHASHRSIHLEQPLALLSTPTGNK